MPYGAAKPLLCGNWNCTFPAFHLACRRGICQKRQTTALSLGQGARLWLRGGGRGCRGGGWEWAGPPSSRPATMEKCLGGMADRAPSAQARPSESFCWPGTELMLRQGARPGWGHMLPLSEPDGQFWVPSGGALRELRFGILSLAGGALGPPLVSCQSGFLENSLALEGPIQRAQRHAMNMPRVILG